MAKTAFAPPKSARAQPEPSKDDPLAEWLNTPDGEVAFFRALIDRRPVGTAKHWAMIDITLALKKTAPPPAYEKLPLQQPWEKYNAVYNSAYLVRRVRTSVTQKLNIGKRSTRTRRRKARPTPRARRRRRPTRTTWSPRTGSRAPTSRSSR